VQEHIEFAQVLRKLREENDYLIVASGSSSHNLRDLFTSMHSGKPSIYTK
jgi:aromatic ring-opening dioxygenase catalytic subunit (LigB family)